MRRFLTRLVLFPLALVFLFEAWLWEHLAPPVAFLVRILPLRRFRAWASARIEGMSPWVSLAIFVVPAIPLFPLKLLGLWLLGKGQWVYAAATIIFAKLVGMGITAFLFELTRPKLLLLPWFRAFYETLLWLLAKAHALVDPLKRQIRRKLRLLSPARAPRALRLVKKLRSRLGGRDQPFYRLASFAPRPFDPTLRAGMRVDKGFIIFTYELNDPEKLVLDSLGSTRSWTKGELARADGLWKTTCFEAFWGEPGREAYWELNLSAGGQYNLYRFESYRAPQPPAPSEEYSVVQVKVTDGKTLEAKLEFASGPVPKELEASLCTVIRLEGRTEYYSVSHVGPKPDFHLRASFGTQPFTF